jgi:hypothetical protein
MPEPRQAFVELGRVIRERVYFDGLLPDLRATIDNSYTTATIQLH